MPRAIIVGGGIAGLASGIAFANAGWEVTVLERAPRIEPMGAALSLWPNACAAMARLGILGAVTAAAAPIRQMLLATRTALRMRCWWRWGQIGCGSAVRSARLP